MRLPPILLVLTAGAVFFGVSQTLAPTVRAQAAPNQTISPMPALRVSVQSLHFKPALGGLEVAGRITNTGRQTLTYPAVVCVFTDAAGAEVGHADGYLTAGPVKPGQSVNVRAFSPKMPAFAAVALRLREAGQSVTVQAPESRRTTVW